MDGDIFVNSKKNQSDSQKSDNNFFVKQELSEHSEPSIYGQVKHINDYDYNILKEGAYKEVSDNILKLEYKITKLEEQISDIDTQIQTAYDINDYSLVNELVAEKKQIQNKLKNANLEYKHAGISTKLSEQISNFNKQNKFSNFVNLLKEILASNLPTGLTSISKFKSSLKKLQNINKSVDELMTMNIPCGEQAEKYNQLSKYIVCANSIQSEISRMIK